MISKPSKLALGGNYFVGTNKHHLKLLSYQNSVLLHMFWFLPYFIPTYSIKINLQVALLLSLNKYSFLHLYIAVASMLMHPRAKSHFIYIQQSVSTFKCTGSMLNNIIIMYS